MQPKCCIHPSPNAMLSNPLSSIAPYLSSVLFTFLSPMQPTTSSSLPINLSSPPVAFTISIYISVSTNRLQDLLLADWRVYRNFRICLFFLPGAWPHYHDHRPRKNCFRECLHPESSLLWRYLSIPPLVAPPLHHHIKDSSRSL